MFLKSLKIERGVEVIRDVRFIKGINLIVDESTTSDRKESGNNVGKTTVLRLIDFCLGGDGKNIYQDPEFKSKTNSQIERFLKDNNVTIVLVLMQDLEDDKSQEITIRRNFLPRKQKIQEINGENYTNIDFPKMLKELMFHSRKDKPTFRQIISKNIRDEKNRLLNTLKVLHANTTQQEYEAVFLFWLGEDISESDRKQRLLSQKRIEENLQKRLRKESTLAQIKQSVLIVNRTIETLTEKKDAFNLNENYEADINALNDVKSEMNRVSTALGRMEMRKSLIDESREDLEREYAAIDVDRIQRLYEEAKYLVPSIQRSFEDTLTFHNRMISEKIKYIGNELPSLEAKIVNAKSELSALLAREKKLSEELKKAGALEDLQKIITDLNSAFETKGSLEEQERLWESSQSKVTKIDRDLEEINKGILSLDDSIQAKVAEFNKYFSDISERMYGEQFILSADKSEKGYELNISSISGNLGTGKKKGQMAAFDLAYIQYADAMGIDCLHFILHDQIENIHDNQITSLLTEIVSQINCQYILPVLRDKLPDSVDVSQYEILSMSQQEKLFRV